MSEGLELPDAPGVWIYDNLSFFRVFYDRGYCGLYAQLINPDGTLHDAPRAVAEYRRGNWHRATPDAAAAEVERLRALNKSLGERLQALMGRLSNEQPRQVTEWAVRIECGGNPYEIVKEAVAEYKAHYNLSCEFREADQRKLCEAQASIVTLQRRLVAANRTIATLTAQLAAKDKRLAEVEGESDYWLLRSLAEVVAGDCEGQPYSCADRELCITESCPPCAASWWLNKNVLDESVSRDQGE